MAAPFNPPVKNEDFEIWIALKSIGDGDRFKVNPQISAGDFKVLTWNQTPGSPTPVEANLATLPQTLKSINLVDSVLVLVKLSAGEMNGDIVVIVGRQQGSPNEWADFVLSIPTTSA